jgi:hypothetical protein
VKPSEIDEAEVTPGQEYGMMAVHFAVEPVTVALDAALS